MHSPDATPDLKPDFPPRRFSGSINFGPNPSIKLDMPSASCNSLTQERGGQQPEHSKSSHPLLRNEPSIPPIDIPIALQSKKRQLRFTTALLIATLPFSGLLFYYLIQILTKNDPKVGSSLLLLSPSETLLLVTILSQTLVLLNHVLMNRILDVLRWQLAMRREGVKASIFFVLGSSMSFIGALTMVRIGGKTTIWSFHKLLTPILFSFTNIILKAQITYPEVYIVQNTTQMFSGLAPLNTTSLLQAHIVETAVICTYFSGFIASILSVPKYVAEAKPVACSGPDCDSIFLPGGVEQIRLLNTSFSGTLLQDGFLDGPDAITSYHTPGYQLDFFPATHFKFDPNRDCTLYGISSGQGLYMCVAVDAESNLVIGWSACPTLLYNQNACITNTTWTEVLQQNVTVSGWKRYAQVTYDSRNLSILDTSTGPWKEAVNYTASDFRLAYDTVLDDNATSLHVVNVSSSQPNSDLYMVESLLYQLGWVLRLYMDFFPVDSKTPTDLLKSMVVIPIQFSTAAWQKINSTLSSLSPNSTSYALPSDLVAKVSTVRRTARVMAVPWSVYTFIVILGAVYFYSLTLFLWLMWQREEIPHISDFVELDFASKLTKSYLEIRSLNVSENGSPRSQSSLKYLQMRDLSNGTSGTLIERFRDKTIRVVAQSGEKKSIVILTSGMEGNGEPLLVGEQYF